jgi:protoporphyrinogen oxidase
MAASFDVAGVRVDHGSHRLHPATDGDLLADLRTLLGEDLQTRGRNGRLRVADRWLSFPLRASELATGLPPRLVAAAARDAALAPFRRGGDASYAAVLRRGLGPTLYDALYGPYARKLWGVDGDQIDAEQARRRVSADTPWKVAARVARGGRTGRGTSQGAVFHYPRRGFGQIVDAVCDAARAAGAEVLTGVEVTSIRARPDGVRVAWDGGSLQARHAFSTLPVTTLGRIARPAPSAQVVQEAAGLHFRAMVLVYLVHEGGRWTGFDAHYLPGLQTPISRISEPANYRDSPTTRPTGRSSAPRSPVPQVMPCGRAVTTRSRRSCRTGSRLSVCRRCGWRRAGESSYAGCRTCTRSTRAATPVSSRVWRPGLTGWPT